VTELNGPSLQLLSTFSFFLVLINSKICLKHIYSQCISSDFFLILDIKIKFVDIQIVI